MVDPEEANTFPRRGKHKERYIKGGTLEEVAYKMGYWNDWSVSRNP